jgi:hypothetical protein
MRIEFTVGREQHRVEFSWGQFFGNSRISVDGKVVLREPSQALEELSLIGTPLRRYQYLYDVIAKGDFHIQKCRSWEIEVGNEEIHSVCVVKERPLVLSGLRPHKYRVLVDGELILERTGY